MEAWSKWFEKEGLQAWRKKDKAALVAKLSQKEVALLFHALSLPYYPPVSGVINLEPVDQELREILEGEEGAFLVLWEGPYYLLLPLLEGGVS